MSFSKGAPSESDVKTHYAPSIQCPIGWRLHDPIGNGRCTHVPAALCRGYSHSCMEPPQRWGWCRRRAFSLNGLPPSIPAKVRPFLDAPHPLLLVRSDRDGSAREGWARDAAANAHVSSARGALPPHARPPVNEACGHLARADGHWGVPPAQSPPRVRGGCWTALPLTPCNAYARSGRARGRPPAPITLFSVAPPTLSPSWPDTLLARGIPVGGRRVVEPVLPRQRCQDVRAAGLASRARGGIRPAVHASCAWRDGGGGGPPCAPLPPPAIGSRVQRWWRQ